MLITTKTFYIEELSSPKHTKNGKRFWIRYGDCGINGVIPLTATSIEEARKTIKRIREYFTRVYHRAAPKLRIKLSIVTELVVE